MTKTPTVPPEPDRPLHELLRLPAGEVDLTALDPRGTPGYPGAGKEDAPELTQALAPALSDLQERLYAAGRVGAEGTPSVLVVLQGMDTSGKGGVIRHAIGMVDPQGVQLTAFKAPTEEERGEHYLERVRRALPRPGAIGIFDRSHYEDVLIARVEELVPPEEWERRYEEINAFEAEVIASGTRVVKCFLHISAAEQGERLAERLEKPEKHWKYNPGDIDARLRWSDYQDAYTAALQRCSTQLAPWHVVPADRKWYRNWAVAQLLLETLRSLDLEWPTADFDVEEEVRRLSATR
ncbi:PPK2 family polyphosphate kinase [Auraticoccus monumenti]|uniref:Polyphosphate:nucleotide phosphotransferase, PPK2 family n=1 Tax=Auraticoccus monumenti TaxID=675864 RepID=A0A1G7C5B7_9ACTN|nr:PPK2 family polyphosphate kinase [Auraticoccus monumenti]SDE34511.1 polyphosphate:nucleotide phosphotransferase, PPK2 family [Auraticoccus monumenti]